LLEEAPPEGIDEAENHFFVRAGQRPQQPFGGAVTLLLALEQRGDQPRQFGKAGGTIEGSDEMVGKRGIR